MYCTYKHNIQARSRKHCCHGKAISIIYSDSVPATLAFQHGSPICPASYFVVICGLPPSPPAPTIFFHIISQLGTNFEKDAI